MKEQILFTSVIAVILSGCATGYPKVKGELMRVHTVKTDMRVPVAVLNRCKHQLVPTVYDRLIIVYKDSIVALHPYANILEEDWNNLTEEYQEALREGIEEKICMDTKVQRRDDDIFSEGDFRWCPVIRISKYTKEDKEFLNVFKNQVLLRYGSEIPKKLGEKIFKIRYPAAYQLTKKIIEQTIVRPEFGECIAMPLKIGVAPGRFFKSYSTKKERKNMLKDKDPNIYWEYPAWGGFFTPDGKVNKEKLKELKEKAKLRKNDEGK